MYSQNIFFHPSFFTSLKSTCDILATDMHSHVAVAPSVVLSEDETATGTSIHDLACRPGNIATRTGGIPGRVATGSNAGDLSLATVAEHSGADDGLALHIGTGGDEVDAPHGISDL